MEPHYYKQENFFPQQSLIEWDVSGFCGMGLSVAGTFTSGHFILEGTGDGVNWDKLKIAKGPIEIIENGQIASIGNYSGLVYGYTKVKLTPVSLVGVLTLKSIVVPQLPPPFLFGA